MRKILYGLSIIVAVTAVVVGATTAFYNDEETSSGNVLAAGSIDLGIDNTSYYNGVFNDGTSWALDWDLDVGSLDELGDPQLLPRLFFNFDDLKPGDWGEDTISLHVDDNDSWLCADVTLTSNDDNGINEPEGDAGDTSDGQWAGELAQHLNWYWWADDGDNVFEECAINNDNGGGQVDPNCVDEELIHENVSFPQASQPTTFTVALADSTQNIWGDQIDNNPGPLPANSDTRYIGKAWCFGETTFQAHPQDGLGVNSPAGPDVRGVVCNGANETNITQTDSMGLDITFRAEQSRHLPGFTCGAR